MTTLYHRAKDGTVKVCKAAKGNCPLDSEHFTDSAEAQKYADQLLEEEYGLLNDEESLAEKDSSQPATSNSPTQKPTKKTKQWIDSVKEISLYEGTIKEGKVSTHFQRDRKERNNDMGANFGPGRPLKTFKVITTDDVETYYQVHDNGRTKIYGDDHTLITEFIPSKARLTTLYNGANTPIPPGLLDITDKNHKDLNEYNKKAKKKKDGIKRELKGVKERHPDWSKQRQWDEAEKRYKANLKKAKKKAANLAARKAKKGKGKGKGSSSLDALFASIAK